MGFSATCAGLGRRGLGTGRLSVGAPLRKGTAASSGRGNPRSRGRNGTWLLSTGRTCGPCLAAAASASYAGGEVGRAGAAKAR